MSIGPAGDVARSTVRPNRETGLRTPTRTLLRTSDGVTIDALYDPGSGACDTSAPPAGRLVFVVAHGFTGEVDRPHVRRVARALAHSGAVVTFSFRGHGRSGGRSTVGDREVLDLEAAVAWARELGHTRVVTVGFSMGGSVVLRHAALHGGTDAVVSVSAPARWYYRGTAPMRRLHWLVTRPAGRLVGRYGLRVRIHHREWDPVPLSPVEAVPRIAPTPSSSSTATATATSPSTTPGCSRRPPVGTANSGWSPAWATPRTPPAASCSTASRAGPPPGRASLTVFTAEPT